MRYFLSLLLLLPSLVWAEDRFTVESFQFIPQSYYVGDRVELRMQVRGEGEDDILEEIPTFLWGEITEARILRHNERREVRIVFTPFQTGTQTLPALDFGGTRLEGVKVHVRSLVDEGRRSLAPPRGPLLLPSTKLYIGFLLGGLLALPLLGTFILVWLRPRVRHLAAWYREQGPYRRFKKDLKILRGQNSLMDARSFYIALLDLIRRYLSQRYGEDCSAHTSRELKDFLRRHLGEGQEMESFLEIFYFGDRVKFGHQQAPLEKRSRDAGQAAETVEALKSRRGGIHANL